MTREIDMATYYLPPFMQEYEEPVEALRAENPEFKELWKATDRILKNHFINTADEYGISRFEKILGIQALKSDTLEFRRAVVLSKWNPQIPPTMKGIKETLKLLCGSEENFIIHYDNDTYNLSVKIALVRKEMREESYLLLKSLIPENINLEVTLLYNTYGFLSRCRHRELEALTYKQVRDEVF